jgi:biopolymer transport protein ExbD
MKISLLSKDDTVDTRIELVPLIDVIFCILTFFILASLTLTRQQAINMGLPKAATGTAVTQADENMIIVSLDATGQTFVQKQPVAREELLAQVQAFAGSIALCGWRTSRAAYTASQSTHAAEPFYAQSGCTSSWRRPR